MGIVRKSESAELHLGAIIPMLLLAVRTRSGTLISTSIDAVL
jgi:hypothetical protein